MKKNLLRHWPLYASLVVFALLVRVALAVSLRQNQGNLVYALDDAYIHMAMAKNLALHGVWGVTPFAFTSSSSSMLWTLLLGLTYKLFGVGELAPLVWNLLFAALILVVADAVLARYAVGGVMRFTALLALIFMTPLPTLVLAGLEQTLQSLLSLSAVFLAARALSGEAPRTARRDAALLLALAPLVTAVRFEGMFLVIALGLLLLAGRRWGLAAAFAFLGFLPVAVYSVVSVSHGWFWLPSSVLLKGMFPDLTSFSRLIFALTNTIFANLYTAIHVYVLLIAVLILYLAALARGRGAFESRQVMGAALLVTALPHAAFVQVGPLFRYDAYLFVLGVVFIAASLPALAPGLTARTVVDPRAIRRYLAGGAAAWCLGIGALASLILIPLGVKGWQLLRFLPQCTTNIYEQQCQMGLFIRQYYNGETVALNDVGAVNYLADIHCLDLWGLASREVTALKRARRFNTAEIDRLTRQAGVRVAILYDHWYDAYGGLPREWISAGQWTIPENVITGGATVSFYAVDPAEASRLCQCLREFSTRLPREVIQSGSYLGWSRVPAAP